VAKTKAANAEEIAIVVHVMIPFDRPRVEAEEKADISKTESSELC